MITLLSAAAAASAVSGGAPTTVPRKAYEFRNLPPGYNTDGFEIAEVLFYASPTGADIAPQAVATATEQASGFPATNANDGDPSTLWTGADNQANTRAITLRLTFTRQMPLHHVSFTRGGRGDFRFYRQVEIWSTDTPDDASSWARVYHSELLDTVGPCQFFPANRKYYMSWSDGGNDYSSLVNLKTYDDKGTLHTGSAGTVDTWEASSQDGRISGAEGTANINSGDPLDTAWSCRGSLGLLAYSPRDDFDCTMIDVKAKDGVHHNGNDAVLQTPLTFTVSVSKDGGVTRTPLWTCGSARPFVANENRRFYHPKYLTRIRLVFGAPINDSNLFCALSEIVLRDRAATAMNGKIVSITASSRYNRNLHEIYVNDGDPGTLWASSQGNGPGSYIEFAFLKADAFDLGAIDITAIQNYPGQTPSSIRAMLDTGAGFVDIDGAQWSGYPAFTGGEKRTLTVYPNTVLYTVDLGQSQGDQLVGMAEFDPLTADGTSLKAQLLGFTANNFYAYGFETSKMIDGDPTTDWASTTDYNVGSRIAFRLPPGLVPAALRITARQAHPESTPRSFTLTRKDTGAVLVYAHDYPAFAAGETRILTTDKFKYQLSLGPAQNDQLVGLSEINLLAPDGSSLQSSIIALDANSYDAAGRNPDGSLYLPTKMIDGNVNTDWTSDPGHNNTSAITFYLLKSLTPKTLNVTARAQYNGSTPTRFTLVRFDDSGQATTILDASGFAGFGQGEKRSYPLSA